MSDFEAVGRVERYLLEHGLDASVEQTKDGHYVVFVMGGRVDDKFVAQVKKIMRGEGDD